MRAAMRALLPDFSRLSLKSATGMHNGEASGSNDPPPPPDDKYEVDWDNMPEEEKEAVIGLLKIEQEEKRSPDVGGATATQKTEWFKGKRNLRRRLSAYVLTNFDKIKWYKIDELKNHPRIHWYWGGEGGGVCGREAGQNSQGGQYGSGVRDRNSDWGPDHDANA